MALSAAQAGMSIRAQQVQAETQEKVQANASEMERRRYLNEASALRIRENQEAIAAAQKIQYNQIKGEEAKSTARTAAGEAGVTGQAVNQTIAALEQAQAKGNFSIAQNMKMKNVQNELRLRDMGLNHQNNLLRINKPIEEVDYFGSVMDGALFGMQMGSLGKEAGFKGFFGKEGFFGKDKPVV